jgi:hypothetical protein
MVKTARTTVPADGCTDDCSTHPRAADRCWLTAAVRPDGNLAVTPAQRITPLLETHIRAHRDELIRALSVVPARQPLGWPPEPSWFRPWMEQDDARRRATMAAGLVQRRPR